MNQGPSNQIGEAAVRITADTAPLQAGLEEAKQQTAEGAKGVADAIKRPIDEGLQDTAVVAQDAGQEIGAGLRSPISTAVDEIKNDLKEMSSEIQTVSRLMLILTTAQKGFTLGQEFRETYEQIKNTREELQKLGSENAIGEGLEGATENARLHLEAVKNAAQDTKKFWIQVYEQILAVGDAVTGKEKLNAWVQKNQSVITEAEQRLQKAIDAERNAAIEKRIEDERAATVEGVEKIEMARAAAVKEARQKYGDNKELMDAIKARYDYEISRQRELDEAKRLAEEEQKKRDEEQKARDEERQIQEMRAIEERKNAYRDFLEATERINKEIADKTARALSDAINKTKQDFASAINLKELVVGIQALNANLDNMRRNRQQIASGELPSF